MNAAAIDLGSNSIKILIVRKGISPKDMHVLFRHRSVVRLGEGTFKKKGSNKIPRPVQLRALKSFQTYAKILEAYDVDVLRATGTSALRDAENGVDFIDEVRKKTGIALEVLPAEEEARLIVKGVLSEIDGLGSKPHIFIDIGGGSCEISQVIKGKTERFVSLPLGAVRLTEHYVSSAKPSPQKVAALINHVRASLKKAWPKPEKIKNACGSAGTVRAIGRILSKTELNFDPRKVKKSQIDQLVAKITKSSRKQLDAMPGVDGKRAEILLAGAAVLREVLNYFGVETLAVSQRGLREGLVLDIFESPGLAPQPKEIDQFELENLEYIHSIGRHYHSQQTHCYHVWHLARQLFDDLMPIHGLDERWKKILMVSALLHDVGKFVNESSSHKHSFYILKNTTFPFLTENERLMVATLARYHRKSPPREDHDGFKDLNADEKKILTKLASLLRMADALDANHDYGVRWLKCQWGPGKLKLHLKIKPGGILDWDTINDKFKLFENTFSMVVSLGELTNGESRSRSSESKLNQSS